MEPETAMIKKMTTTERLVAALMAGVCGLSIVAVIVALVISS
jgi:hypothetical protein